MTDTRDMTLGGRSFRVPRLPFGVSMKAYPLLRKLNNGGFKERWEAKGTGPTEEDMVDVGEVLFLCAGAAEPGLVRDAFDALPIAPSEIFDGFLIARIQSGGWIMQEAGAEPGKTKGVPKPQKSTSAES